MIIVGVNVYDIMNVVYKRKEVQSVINGEKCFTDDGKPINHIKVETYYTYRGKEYDFDSFHDWLDKYELDEFSMGYGREIYILGVSIEEVKTKPKYNGENAHIYFVDLIYKVKKNIILFDTLLANREVIIIQKV